MLNIKNLSGILILLLLMTASIFAQEIPETGLLRIRVDVDSVTVTIDNILTELDSFGNPIQKDLWFIVNLLPGEHPIIINHPEFPAHEVTGNIEIGRAFTIDHKFIIIEVPDTVEVIEPGFATLILVSDPDSANIFINDRTDLVIAPDTIIYPTGNYNFESETAGYIGLNHNMILKKDQTYSIKFVMQTPQPEPVTMEDLGLEYQVKAQFMSEELAKIQREKFMNMAETFTIIPLGQGLLARMVLSENDNTTANIMILSGVVLTAGSYILGKILPKRKLEQIREHNEIVTAENMEAQFQNQTIDKQVDIENGIILNKWLEENTGRGEVIVEIVE